MPNENDLRVWWAREVPIKKSLHFPVRTVEEAKKKIKDLTERDLKNPKVTDNVMELFGGEEFLLYFYWEAMRE